MSHAFIRKARLGFYLAWLPMTALLLLLLVVHGGLGITEATVSALVLCPLYALICGASWYMTRVMPLRRTGLLRLLSTYVGASALASGIWVGLLSILVHMVPPGWRAGLVSERPLLFGMGLLYFLLSVAFHYIILAMDQSRRAEQQALASKELAQRAELKALRAQINPHFLFNSLNSIAALAGSEPDRAREMCLLLSGFLRSTLGLADSADIALADELALTRQYLHIEQVRFGDRLEVVEDIQPSCLDWPVPALILQPLVENAIKHGVAGLTEGGTVKLSVRCTGQRLILEVENPYDPEQVAEPGGGHGLAILRARLKARFGTLAGLDAAGAEGRYGVRLELDRQS